MSMAYKPVIHMKFDILRHCSLEFWFTFYSSFSDFLKIIIRDVPFVESLVLEKFLVNV